MNKIKVGRKGRGCSWEEHKRNALRQRWAWGGGMGVCDQDMWKVNLGAP